MSEVPSLEAGLRPRDLIALRALREAGAGEPLPERPGDNLGVRRAGVRGLVERGLLPDQTYGATLDRLRRGGFVDGYRVLVNSTWEAETMWWLTDHGRAALETAPSQAVREQV